MATLTDEDVLELVDRFDIPLEDTVEIERLTKALGEKLSAAGVEYVSANFLDRFMTGLTLKYEMLPEISVSFHAYKRPSTKHHPGGYYQPVYADAVTGKFISKKTVLERVREVFPEW